MPSAYWNHNSAYHPWLLEIAATHHGDVLDVGCGEGLLAQRLAAVSRSVTAIDPDPASLERCTTRLASVNNADAELAGFADYQPGHRRFDLITFVASIHHMDTTAALRKARALLVPGGEIAIVGLSVNKTISDWAWSAACVPFARLGSWLHSETRNVGVPVAEPSEGLREIRAIAADLLPNASIRRGLYYRYLLRWRDAPAPSRSG
jgi:2-polyprenyl-3-methyl-5-hydroxy-6-metoxy-1,4-benzoquinol methylase